MAHGFECVKCGYQETTHLYYRDEHPGCCTRYRSPSAKVEAELTAEQNDRDADVKQRRRGTPSNL